MKKRLFSTCALFSLITYQAFAGVKPAEALLHQMSQASKDLSYELSYILIKKSSIEPLLYRHANHERSQYAHLMYLSGPVREVIQRDSEVSYIETGSEPFTIESGKMVAPITLSFLEHSFKKLKLLNILYSYFNFSYKPS